MMAFVVVILLSLQSATAQGLETHIPLFNSILELYNLKHPLIIFRNVNDENLHQLSTSTSPAASFVSYDSDEEMVHVADHARAAKAIGELDSVLFVGTSHRRLINALVNDVKLFRSGVIGVLSESEYQGGNSIERQFA